MMIMFGTTSVQHRDMGLECWDIKKCVGNEVHIIQFNSDSHCHHQRLKSDYNIKRDASLKHRVVYEAKDANTVTQHESVISNLTTI